MLPRPEWLRQEARDSYRQNVTACPSSRLHVPSQDGKAADSGSSEDDAECEDEIDRRVARPTPLVAALAGGNGAASSVARDTAAE